MGEGDFFISWLIQLTMTANGIPIYLYHFSYKAVKEYCMVFLIGGGRKLYIVSQVPSQENFLFFFL